MVYFVMKFLTNIFLVYVSSIGVLNYSASLNGLLRYPEWATFIKLDTNGLIHKLVLRKKFDIPENHVSSENVYIPFALLMCVNLHIRSVINGNRV